MDQACERVREALGRSVLSPEHESHLHHCPTCAFDHGLRQQLRRARGPASAFLASAHGAPFALVPEVIRQGAKYLDRYRILGFLGGGGQGCVWRAFDELMDDEVALKFLKLPAGAAPDGKVRAVKHENVCRVHDVKHDQEDDVHYLVMEHVEGQPLARRIGSLSPAEALAIFAGICRGVAAMHARQVLHLDLKPQNILLRDGVPVVTDFGMAMRLRDDGRAEPARGGTRGYMAPEHAEGEPVDERADVFSLGVMLAEMHPSPDARLKATIDRARAVRREDRFPTAEALLRAVLPPPVPRWRWPARAAAAVGAALSAGAVAMLIWTPRPARARWRPELWGLDTVPREAWNVALNPAARGLPAIETPHRAFGCGRAPWELLDGRSQYSSWEHGLAFLPPPTIARPRYGCVAYSALTNGRCGSLSPDGLLCRFDGKGNMEVLPERGRDIGRFSERERESIGQVYDREECGVRTIDVVLDDVYPVLAVRLWHHGSENTAREHRVQVLDETSTWREVGRIEWAVPLPPERQTTGAAGPSAPMTSDFLPVRTRRVRVLVNTCSTISDEDLRLYRDRHRNPQAVRSEPGYFWLYELEIFARLSKPNAWRRWLFASAPAGDP